MPTTNVKNAILKAKIEGVIYEFMVKTTAANVYVDDTTTLASKLTTVLADIATRATKDEMTTALAEKAEKVHTHEQADIVGLTDLIATLATNTALTEAINALRQEMLGDTPVEAYNTFTELAAYIAEHKDAADALTSAIGLKADKTTVDAIQATIDGLGTLATKSEITEAELGADLKAKINASAAGNHSHDNKAVLDSITEAKVTDWDDAVAKEHEHANKAVLDDINATKVAAWDAAEQNAKDYADGLAPNYDAAGSAAQALTDAKAYADGLNTTMDGRVTAAETTLTGKARVIVAASEPADLTDKDLWLQTV